MIKDKQKYIAAAILLTGFLCYTFILYSTLPAENNTPDQEATRGKLVWQQYNCNACHQVYGLGGYLGPDLTNVYSLKGKEYIKAFLQNGTPIMPDFHLSREEMDALVAYLKNIDASGKADPRTFTTNWDGTIEQ